MRLLERSSLGLKSRRHIVSSKERPGKTIDTDVHRGSCKEELKKVTTMQERKYEGCV